MLGDKVKSKVTGFNGTVTAKCEYLHSDTTYYVTANELVDGEQKSSWFSRAELIKAE